MRKKLVLLMILATALIALPSFAQNAQDWQSTSTMKGSGSSYSSQVTAVGAVGVSEMGTTTTGPAKAPTGPRRVIEANTDPGQLDEGSPIGDALLPLLMMSLAFCGYLYLRRKRSEA